MEKEKVEKYINTHPDYLISDIQRLIMSDRAYCMKLLEEIGELIWLDNQWIYKRDIDENGKYMNKRRFPLQRISVYGGFLFILLALIFCTYRFTYVTSKVMHEQTMEVTTDQIEKEILSVTHEDKREISAMKERYSKPEAALDFLFGIAMLDKVDMFPDAFTTNRFFEDFKTTDGKSKIETIKEAMNRLTKNGTLEKIKIMKSKDTSLEKGTVRFVVDLYFKELEDPIRVQIKVQKNETEKQIYYVKTPIWNIIERIEKG